MKLTPLAAIGEAYFIRLIDNKNVFLHYNGKDYIAKEGTVGACVWKKKQARNLLDSAKQKNLEMIPVRAVLKTHS